MAAFLKKTQYLKSCLTQSNLMDCHTIYSPKYPLSENVL